MADNKMTGPGAKLPNELRLLIVEALFDKTNEPEAIIRDWNGMRDNLGRKFALVDTTWLDWVIKLGWEIIDETDQALIPQTQADDEMYANTVNAPPRPNLGTGLRLVPLYNSIRFGELASNPAWTTARQLKEAKISVGEVLQRLETVRSSVRARSHG